MSTLEIKNLHVSVADKEILKGIDLTIKENEIHALLGPNGNGKSTLLSTIMGQPKYVVTEGEILLDGKDVLRMSVDERAKAGLFLALQYPPEIPGVINSDFLKAAINAKSEKPVSLYKFISELENATKEVNLPLDMIHRNLNDGFSGGEKKRNEIIQMKLLKPSIAMLDEIDSGLDVDALKVVASSVEDVIKRNGSALVVSHYARFYQLIKPTHVHVIVDGKIILTGNEEIVEKIDKQGFDWVKAEYGIDVKKNDMRPSSIGLCGVKESIKNAK
ncbi:MAG: Fe-S cluster assembly ATPase SufC [Candidatus Caccosoma sp.]|nr:Fe-S cluster assembly ATPase SufC [Candidatus Caccosoma sp.]